MKTTNLFKSLAGVYLFYALLVFSPFVTSCKKDDPVKITDTLKLPQPGSANISMKFRNVCNGTDLVLDSKRYLNANGDTFFVSKFNYYITNVVFVNENGNNYVEPESYHLIMAEDAARHEFNVASVPPGSYKSVKFLIGVDSARNVSGAQTGALDPSLGMFWTWSTGYIMALMEGSSPSSTAVGNNLAFHIAGFSGKENGIKPVEITFPSALVIDGSKTKKLTLKADLDTWFSAPNVIDFALTPNVVTINATSKLIANNYSRMLTLESIE
jgi:hypothetical protein